MACCAAPTGHTLRFLSTATFVRDSLGKLIRIRQRLSSAGAALRGLFGASEQQDEALQKLEKLQVQTLLPPSPPPSPPLPARLHFTQQCVM